MLMVSAFLAWTAQRTLGLSWWASIVIAIAGGALLGFVVEYAIVRRSPTATPGDVLIITLGLSLVLRALAGMIWRSEEHTSELQSQSNLVCRLLLEKKNT